MGPTGRDRLSRRSLRRLPPDVSAPTYDRDGLRAGVVHIGVGRFHRAHQAAYFDRLAEDGVSRDWGVTGVGMRSADAHRSLVRQDGLYTLCEPGEDGPRLRVVGHLKHALFAPTQSDAVLSALASPQTKVVSLTVTAPPYLEPAHVLGDGAFGLVAEGLRRRRAAGVPPFTVLSCDNVADNGPAARRQVLAAAERLDASLAAWVQRNVAFPRTMVDRITPPLTEAMRRAIGQQLSVDDACAVVTEPFVDWVVEDDFCNERPPLDQVGVRYVADARPYKAVKTRLLNGSHCALGFLGGAAGLETSAAAMADPAFAGFVEQMMRDEVAPHLPGSLGIDLAAYQRSVLDRLSSTALTDPLERLRARGSVRVPSYVLPSLHDALRRGGPHDRLTLVVAGWVVHLRRGGAVDETDPGGAMLRALARNHGGDVRPLLRHSSTVGALAEHTAWVAALQWTVHTLETRGVRAALADLGCVPAAAPVRVRTPRPGGTAHAAAS